MLAKVLLRDVVADVIRDPMLANDYPFVVTRLREALDDAGGVSVEEARDELLLRLGLLTDHLELVEQFAQSMEARWAKRENELVEALGAVQRWIERSGSPDTCNRNPGEACPSDHHHAPTAMAVIVNAALGEERPANG